MSSSALDGLSGLEVAQRIVSGEIPPPPIGKLLDMRIVAIEPGVSTFTLEVSEKHYNPMGTLHGGVLCDVADAAVGMAFFSTLDPGETFTTLELKINFLKPVWKGTLTAIGRVIKRGRTIGLVECDVTDEGGSLVAHATATQMALRGAAAQGR